jgi:hypothetical protein
MNVCSVIFNAVSYIEEAVAHVVDVVLQPRRVLKSNRKTAASPRGGVSARA